MDRYEVTFVNSSRSFLFNNPNRSIALVSKEAIKMLEFTNRKNKNATPEYAVWVKSRMPMSYDVDFVFALYIFNVAFSDDQFSVYSFNDDNIFFVVFFL
jgi:hypothetical protein